MSKPKTLEALFIVTHHDTNLLLSVTHYQIKKEMPLFFDLMPNTDKKVKNRGKSEQKVNFIPLPMQ